MIEVQSFKHVQNPTEMNLMENIVGDSFSLLIVLSGWLASDPLLDFGRER